MSSLPNATTSQQLSLEGNTIKTLYSKYGAVLYIESESHIIIDSIGNNIESIVSYKTGAITYIGKHIEASHQKEILNYVISEKGSYFYIEDTVEDV